LLRGASLSNPWAADSVFTGLKALKLKAKIFTLSDRYNSCVIRKGCVVRRTPWGILGTPMILCFTSAEEGDNDEACQEKQG
jgi:hypothetical protein